MFIKKDIWMQFRHPAVWLRRSLLFLIDLHLSVLSLYISLQLRFDGAVPEQYLAVFFGSIPLLLVCRAATFFYFGFYTRDWEYSSLEDLIQILKAVITGTLLVMFCNFLIKPELLLPRSVILIDMVVLVSLLGGVRLVWRLWKERKKTQHVQPGGVAVKVLIMGAGDTGVAFLKNMRKQFPQFQVCGFIDDDPMKWGKRILGVKVFGNRSRIPRVAAMLGAKEVFIASNYIKAKDLNHILEICNESKLHYKMVAPVIDLATNEIHSSKIRNIEIADLLGREPVSLDLMSITHLIQGKRVLVTGAGGSIGSELCGQILEFQPSAMILLDKGENYLHDLSLKLKPLAKKTELHFEFCSITNKDKIASIFFNHQPQVIFHAAAHKHVPLMEENPDEAVINNIYGTKLLADLASKYGVQKFVMVSTDKVVRPTNVMGMTKKIAEMYVQHMGSKSQTRFMTVRFGNVLGSNGSVVPLFKKQIEAGGPITITHPEMRRFFMLVSEAAQLIVQAAALGNGQEIFILEMGDQIKIMDLARKMIRLSGYTPDEDIELKVTGRRPGEKLYEELIDAGEKSIPTVHRKICVLRSQVHVKKEFEADLEEFLRPTMSAGKKQIKETLEKFIAAHQPQRASQPAP
ncbi:MAG: polysaccharide biosynthesis protein [Desulfobacterales bacterium]